MISLLLKPLMLLRNQSLTVIKVTLALFVVYVLIILLKNEHETSFMPPSPFSFSSNHRNDHAPHHHHLLPPGTNGRSFRLLSSVSAQRINETFTVNDAIQISRYEENCGLHHNCPTGHFSVHIYTGLENKQYPRLCLDSKYIIDKDINGCGRGINVAVVDSVTRSILSVSNYDTYTKDSSALETLLLTIRKGDIVILLTFDEPSSKLSQVTRLLLHELGSGMAQNLQHRASWYLVTQKGIKGYSPFEEIHLPTNAGWGRPHDVRTCLPLKIEGVSVQAEDTIIQNKPRKKFCRKYRKFWPFFCESHIVNDALLPSTLLKALPTATSDILRTPVVVFTSRHSIQANIDLSFTLETLIRQPGVIQKNVVVFYSKKCCKSIEHLVDLFGFMSEEYSENQSQESINSPLEDALFSIKLLFPEAKQMILIDSHVILAPDFLPLMTQMIPVLRNPSSGITAISSWNENGLMKSSSDPKLLLRASFKHYKPRFGIMIPMEYLKHVKVSNDCLTDSWSLNDCLIFNPNDYLLFPDLSRSYYIRPQVTDSSHEEKFSSTFMVNPRSVNLQEDITFDHLNELTTSKSYENLTLALMKESISFYSLESAADFVEKFSSTYSMNIKSIVIYSDDESEEGSSPEKICSFFSLANCHAHFWIKSVGGILRFSVPYNLHVILVFKNSQS